MLPVGIVGAGDRLEIIRGDAYFQSYICHIPRSTIELALTRRLDALDGMLFPSICDVIRNLSGMWTLLFPERYVRYMDVPQNFDAAVGGAFWRFTRLTNAFSKKLTNLRAAVALHFAHYNFVRIHQSLRMTPAMAAGIASHLWGIEQLITGMETEQ